MIVAKFGGTSVSTNERVLTLCNIVGKELKRKPIVVVSALSRVTDLLLSLPALPKNQSGEKIQEIRNLHKNLVESLWIDKKLQNKVSKFIDSQLSEVTQLTGDKKFNKQSLDKLASYGEIMSSYIVTEALMNKGIQARQVMATKLIITDDNFGSADFLLQSTKRNIKRILTPLIEKGIVPVITGFIGSTKGGQVTTLGRGGSDYTASIIGFCLGASEIQIWTDVDGIMTADPKIVKKARSVELVSYEEAAELAVLGAKVLHPKTILPAVTKNIPVRILNTFNPSHKGTTIMQEVRKLNYISSIACRKGIKVINIHAPKMFLMHGFLYKIFKIFNELEISVDFISTSEVNISLTIDGHYNTMKLVEKLKDWADVSVRHDRATVSVVGRPSGNAPMVCGRIYTFFENKKINIEMISLGASKINETVVVRQEDANNVVKILHKTFFGV